MSAKTVGDAIEGERTVTQALAAVARELPAIGKDQTSNEGYKYRGIEQIIAEAGPLLAKHGVVILPVASVTEIVATPAAKDGWTDVRMTVTWRIYGPDGSMIEATTCGIGRDRADKGSNKAQSQAYKYLLLPLLHVADKADEAENADVRGAHEDARPDPVHEAMQALRGATPEQKVAVREALGFTDHATANQIAEALRAQPQHIARVRALIEEKAA